MTARRSLHGVSLLEILFTISLLTVVLVVFAAVYPSGYKLNRKSAKANIAVSTATAVAAELQGLPFQDQRPNFPTLSGLRSTNPSGVPTFIQTQMRTKIPEGFNLPNDGIQVDIFPTAIDSTNALPQIAYITVTIYWTDVNDMSLQRHCSIATCKTENQVGR